MDQPVPPWLDCEFLTQCLQKEDGKEGILVTNFSATAAAPPGNNYGSCVLRVTVEYRDSKDDKELHSLSLIVKSELTEGVMKDLVDEIDFVEPIFYKRFLPEARRLMNITFAPKNLFSPRHTTTVMEDLKEQGFLMADKIKLLDFDHCQLYVTAAASLHAVSFAVHKHDPELVESMGKEKLFSYESKTAQAFKMRSSIAAKCLADNIERTEKFQKYGKVIRDISENIWDMLVEAHKPSEVLNTINQGDPAVPNMMFKYDDDGKVCQVKLLDFQLLRYGSPINDLVFFIWMSANHDVRRNRLEELYHIYLNRFNNNLEKLKCSERLSYEHLKNIVDLLSPLAIYFAGFSPLLGDPPPVDVAVLFQSDEKETEDIFNKCYNESYCTEKLGSLLEEMEVAGVFEFLKNK